MIKISLIILTGLIVVRLMKTGSAAARHWVLSATIACAAAAPVIELVAPAWGESIARSTREASNLRPSAVVAPPGVQTTWQLTGQPQPPSTKWSAAWLAQAARITWFAGAGTCVLLVVVGLGRLRWIATRSDRLRSGQWVDAADIIRQHYGIRRRVALLQSAHPSLLVTWGLWRPKIILPASAPDWTDERVRIVLSHELAHIQRGDWLTQLVAELLRCVYWFNPIVWMASRRLRQESEHACDDVVLRLGIGGPQYAGHLLALARASRNHRLQSLSEAIAPAMARPGSLERRVVAMLSNRVNRAPLSGPARAATVAGLLAITAALGGFRAQAQTFASLSGTVLDPHNRTVPAVTVSMTNIVNRAKHEVISDDRGRYEFVGLPPGEYQLDVTKMGFKNFRTTMSLQAKPARADVALQIGSLTETVSIQGSPGERPKPDPARDARAIPAASLVQACQPSGQGGEIRPPMKIRNVNPIYPDPEGKLEGIVIVEGRVATDGTVTQAKVLRSPNPELERSALDAFEQWLFTPTLLNCVPIEVTITATLNFTVKP
jgi:TonB family protein